MRILRLALVLGLSLLGGCVSQPPVAANRDSVIQKPDDAPAIHGEIGMSYGGSR